MYTFRGYWIDGITVEANPGVDTTVSGPLFQMQPYILVQGVVMYGDSSSQTMCK